MRVDRQHWEKNPAKPSVVPVASPHAQFVKNALLGRMTPEDQAYMGRAILMLSDENAEMRARIEALEMVVRGLAQPVKANPVW